MARYYHHEDVHVDGMKSTFNLTPVLLLEALEGCIKGHQALLAAGFLHRDISTNNLMINNQAVPPAPKSFLIDLDLAIGYPITDRSSALYKNRHESFHVGQLACPKITVTNWSQMNPESLKQSKRIISAIPTILRRISHRYMQIGSHHCVHEFAKIMGDPAKISRQAEQERITEAAISRLIIDLYAIFLFLRTAGFEDAEGARISAGGLHALFHCDLARAGGQRDKQHPSPPLTLAELSSSCVLQNYRGGLRVAAFLIASFPVEVSDISEVTQEAILIHVYGHHYS
ncbi:hypothetical protein PCANC_00769 [Puccinia coronata f. sp. avenae]|uniref:Fungal-type protein kinase domain-containing protein n=1 Tax=Puccinia coronata f. sp. avenae TaxID=200324 RepID=A0A2N5W6U3_9BASI|nr:hypothetical protein PCANC_00769 [Puccinia coronata f. sp. avenae]